QKLTRLKRPSWSQGRQETRTWLRLGSATLSQKAVISLLFTRCPSSATPSCDSPPPRASRSIVNRDHPRPPIRGTVSGAGGVKSRPTLFSSCTKKFVRFVANLLL